IHSGGTFINPPLLAWLWTPLVAFPEPVAYLIWTVVSLAALVWAWHIVAPFQGLAKVALLLAGLALWPVMEAFYFGQPTMLVLALVASAWWLMRHDRLLVAWRRRDNPDVVFAAGLLGSLMVSFHLHQPDYSNLLLAAWLVLRGAPSLAHKAWLGVGFVTMQVLTMGLPAPQLAWNLVWL